MKEKVDWEEKVWGRVLHIFSSDKAAVSYLEVKKGFQCSRHFHKYRQNNFLVISGKILIQEWEPNDTFEDWRVGQGERLMQTVLSAGQIHSVPTFIDHRFCVLESGIVVEYYCAESELGKVSIGDIIRKDVGGEIPKELLRSY